MKTAAIIAEFDPFHNGHLRLINAVKKAGYTHIVAVLSGSFVQRGDMAAFLKFDRAMAALSCGVDLVVENPLPWAMSTARNFATGGIAVARDLCCDSVALGSECGDISLLRKTAAALEKAEADVALKKNLKKGVTFARARESALSENGYDTSAVTRPNDILAVEYIRAAKRLSYNPRFIAVKREGAGHNAKFEAGGTVSSSKIREYIAGGDFTRAAPFMPESSRKIIGKAVAEGRRADISALDKAVLAKLRAMPPERFANLPDVSEGLERRVYKCSRTAATLEELYFSIKTKRYTLARIRRAVLSAFLDMGSEFFGGEPPYVRVLAVNSAGEEILKYARGAGKTKIVMRTTELRGNSVFEAERVATDLFALACRRPLPCGLDYCYGLIKA